MAGVRERSGASAAGLCPPNPARSRGLGPGTPGLLLSHTHCLVEPFFVEQKLRFIICFTVGMPSCSEVSAVKVFQCPEVRRDKALVHLCWATAACVV